MAETPSGGSALMVAPSSKREDSSPALSILPLGGCGEVGLNATLLVSGADAVLVDCGALLGIEDAPGVEKAVPGFEPLFAEGRRLLGVVLTHGHEDHIGALPALLAELDVPVFGTPLTIALARTRLERTDAPVAREARRQAQGRLLEVALGQPVKLGPFELELVRVTHSLPDCAALHITTPAGRVLFSGDFKLDAQPIDGQTTDTERLRALGDAGVDLLLSDSTNSEVPGPGRSESQVAAEMSRLIAESPHRVVVALMASHLHRLQAVVDAALRHGRKVVFAGRALEEMSRVGIERGHLRLDPSVMVSEARASALARNQLLVVATGTQGEPGSGLVRLANGNNAALTLLAGDRVIFSARTIPGNERAVRRLQNQLLRAGVEVVHERMALVHCSGHAHAGEQRVLLDLVRPKNFVPIHGERTMLEAHARTAREAGVPTENILVVENGESVVLRGGAIARGPDEPVSKRPLDGEGRVLDWGDVRERARIGRAGLAVCSLAWSTRGTLAGAPVVTTRGIRGGAQVAALAARAVAEALCDPVDDLDLVENVARSAVRRVLKKALGRAPEVEVHVIGL